MPHASAYTLQFVIFEQMPLFGGAMFEFQFHAMEMAVQTVLPISWLLALLPLHLPAHFVLFAFFSSVFIRSLLVPFESQMNNAFIYVSVLRFPFHIINLIFYEFAERRRWRRLEVSSKQIECFGMSIQRLHDANKRWFLIKFPDLWLSSNSIECQTYYYL